MVQGENREDRLMPHWQRGTGFANKKSDAWFNLKDRLQGGATFGVDWGKPGDDRTVFWTWSDAGPEPAADFPGPGPMLDFRRGADGVWKREPTPA